MLDLWSRDAIHLQASEMLESTMASSASIRPACSGFKSHTIKFSISNLLLFFVIFSIVGLELPSSAAAAAVQSTASQRVRTVAIGKARRRSWRRKFRRGESRELEQRGEEKGRTCNEEAETTPAVVSTLSLSLSLSALHIHW